MFHGVEAEICTRAYEVVVFPCKVHHPRLCWNLVWVAVLVYIVGAAKLLHILNLNDEN